jgi:DNA repair exonuclease SbcCD ATPase subunit
METTDEQNGQDSLQQLQQALASAQKGVTDSQAKLQEYTDKKTALQKAVDDAVKNKDALGKQRDGIKQSLDDAAEAGATRLAELKSQLSAEHRKQVDEAVKQVEDNIQKKQDKVNDLNVQLGKAQTAADTAKNDAADAKNKFDDLQKQLKQLATDSTAAKDKVVKLRTSMEAAYSGGKLTEAYFLVQELDKEISRARGMIDPEKEAGLLKQLALQWSGLAKAVTDASSAAATLDATKQEVTKTEKDLEQAQKDRDATIRQKLAEIANPPAPASPDTEQTPGRPTEPTTERQQDSAGKSPSGS